MRVAGGECESEGECEYYGCIERHQRVVSKHPRGGENSERLGSHVGIKEII